MALTAWLIAPAPIACTSTRPLLRMTPAMAPATATGFEVAETLSTSTGVRSAVIAGTPSNTFSVDTLDRRCSSGGRCNGNEYGSECHGSRGHHEAVWDPAQKALEHHVLVHPDASVPRPDHAHVRDVGRAAGQDAGVRGRDVGVRAHHGARPPVQVPTHRRLLGRRLRMHVAKDDRRVGVRGQDGFGGAKRVVQGVEEEDPTYEVHHQHLLVTNVRHTPALARGCRRAG